VAELSQLDEINLQLLQLVALSTGQKLKSLMKVREARTKVEQHSTEKIQAVAEETLSPTTMLFELEWDELVQPLASPMSPAHCQAEQGD